jgi:hypothetical protein
MKSRLAFATSLTILLVAGCAAKSTNSADDAAAADAKAQARAEKQAAKAGRPAPAGTKLAQIQLGMADTDVRRILGEPDSSKNYVTGKQFIPYYYGTDTARTEWIYHKQGRITLSRNQYTGGLKVIRVDYDPGI